MNAQRIWPIGLGLIFLTAALYWPTVFHDFVNYDDPLYVTDNPHVQRGLHWEGVRWAFRSRYASNWHPLTWLSHMLDWTLFGSFAGGHHLTNLLWHCVNVLLVFLLLRRMTGATWRCAWVAGLFAWHPLHVESVAWIAERKDVLSTCLLLLTVWAYVRYTERPGCARYAAVTGLFSLGLMAKPMLVTLPWLLLLLDYWPLGRVGRSIQHTGDAASIPAALPWRKLGRLVSEKVPLFVLAALCSALTLWAQNEGGAVKSLEVVPLTDRMVNALAAYAGYLGKMLCPVGLAVFYPQPASPPADIVFVSAALLVLLSAGAWWNRSKRPWLLVGWLIYLGTLVPVIGFVQVGKQAMADRYTYVPLLGIFVAVAWTLADWRGCSRIRLGLALFVAMASLAICLASTRAHLKHWQNSVTLFTHALRVTDHNSIAHNNLGTGLDAMGQADEAAAHYRAAIRLNPDYTRAHYNLGLALAGQGKPMKAAFHFKEILRLNPNSAVARNNLGVMLAKDGRWPEALAQFTEAARLNPDYPNPQLNWAKVLVRQHRIPEALVRFRTALRLRPDWPEALDQMAWLLCTHPDAGVRDAAMAVTLAEKASRLAGGEQPAFLDTLAAAYAESGRFENAAQTARKARALAERDKQTNLVSLLDRRLEHYRAGQPWREWDVEPFPQSDLRLKPQELDW